MAQGQRDNASVAEAEPKVPANQNCHPPAAVRTSKSNNTTEIAFHVMVQGHDSWFKVKEMMLAWLKMS